MVYTIHKNADERGMVYGIAIPTLRYSHDPGSRISEVPAHCLEGAMKQRSERQGIHIPETSSL